MNEFLTGLTLMLSLIMAIGAQNTFVLRQGLRREHVGVVVFLCAFLDGALVVLGVSGVAKALGDHPQWLNVIAALGSTVLIFYGVLAARRALFPHHLQAATDGTPVPLMRVLVQVLSLSLLNPHVYLDTVILVGAVGAQQPADARVWFVVGAALASTLWFTALGYGARLLQPLFARPVAWRILDSVTATMMFVLAYYLAAPLFR